MSRSSQHAGMQTLSLVLVGGTWLLGCGRGYKANALHGNTKSQWHWLYQPLPWQMLQTGRLAGEGGDWQGMRPLGEARRGPTDGPGYHEAQRALKISNRKASRARPRNDKFSAEQLQTFAVTLDTVWKRLCFLPWRDHLSCFEAPRLQAGTYRLKFVLIAVVSPPLWQITAQ